MAWPVPLPEATGDEVADLAAFDVWEQAVERVHHPDRFGPDGARPPQPRSFDYYLGVPEPSWLGKQDTDAGGVYLCSGIPKFVSASRLARYRTDGERWPVTSICTYAIDSGAYIALNGTNTDVPWFADPDTYGGMILRFIGNNGYPPDFCAPQDWPCEPPVRAKTGFTVRQHQEFTLDAYLWMAREFYMVPWIPVLQGWDAGDYLEHEKMYLDAGVDLAGARRVGVGSICRRGHLPEIVDVVEQFADRGYKLHGFGIKTTALPIIGGLLRSADSMAWSFNARYSNIRLPGCTHAGNCANCYRYAVHWREQVLASLPNPEEEVTVPATTARKAVKKKTPSAAQLDLFAGLADFAALVTTDLGLTETPGPGLIPPADTGWGRPRPIPMADAEWGMYGQVNGYGPTGDRRTETGYIVKPPRVTVGGFSSIGKKVRRKGDRLLHFDMSRTAVGGVIGMFAEMDAVFTMMELPADQPLLAEKRLSLRCRVLDLHEGDVFHIWDEPGLNHDEHGDQRPRYHVQGPPVPVGDGSYDLEVLVNGQVITRRMHGETYADVDDPQDTPWRRAQVVAQCWSVAVDVQRSLDRAPLSPTHGAIPLESVKAEPLELFDLDALTAAVDAALAE